MFVDFAQAARSKRIIIIALLLAFPLSIKAQQSGDVTLVAPVGAKPLAETVLAETLAGVKATGEVRRYNADNLAELVGDKSPIFREYHVASATSRLYGPTRVDLLETGNQFAAYGLLTYFGTARDPKAKKLEIGMEAMQLAGAVIFYKGNYFVRVANADQKKKADSNLRVNVAQAVADTLPPGNQSVSRPPLFDSLAPAIEVASGAGFAPVASSERYFLGPASLGTFVERAGSLFVFEGEAEAVMIECAPDAMPPQRDKIEMIIVEYHTPQFATDAMRQVTDYVESLSESERNRIAVRREGNYIVGAFSEDNKELAARMVESIKYPYGVKWLHHPLLPSRDPFREQKAAQMLISTFAVLGAILGTVLIFGVIFGTSVFLRRRKFQREIFSDAGGMLRLELDPMERVILGLPPRRSEE